MAPVSGSSSCETVLYMGIRVWGEKGVRHAVQLQRQGARKGSQPGRLRPAQLPERGRAVATLARRARTAGAGASAGADPSARADRQAGADDKIGAEAGSRLV